MSKIKCVAASGVPRENAGYLLPVFQKKDGKCFDVGGEDFSASVLANMIQEKDAMRLEPIAPGGPGYSVKALRRVSETADHYGFSAYVFFFSKAALISLGKRESISAIACKHGAIIVKPLASEWAEHLFFLIDRKNLVDRFIPEILEFCKKRIDDILVERLSSPSEGSSILVKGEQDVLAQIAQIMMNVTDGERKRLDEAIQYYGAILLLSPLAKNYPVWLDFVLSRWNHPARDKQHWNRLVRDVQLEAERRAAVARSQRNIHKFAAVEERGISNQNGIANLERPFRDFRKEHTQLRDIIQTIDLYISSPTSIGGAMFQKPLGIYQHGPSDIPAWSKQAGNKRNRIHITGVPQ